METGKVLIADGSLFIRTMLQSQLESMGFNVVATAKNGHEARTKYQETHPDIAMLDIMLAEVDEFALIRALQTSGRPGIIVMIPEETSLPALVVNAVRAGASGYITKPISPEDLKSRISNVLLKGPSTTVSKSDPLLNYEI